MADSIVGEDTRFYKDEYLIETPEVFLDLPVAYGETRIDYNRKNHLRFMSGNTTYRPQILAEAREQFSPRRSPERWYKERQKEAQFRIGHLRRLLGFRAIHLTHPQHGTNLALTDFDDYDRLNAETVIRNRIDADAIFTDENRLGTMFNPADCIVANVAYYKGSDVVTTGQIHAGTKGLINNIAEKTLHTLQIERNLQPRDAVVYISPFNKDFEIYGSHLDQANQAGLGDYISTGRGKRRKFKMGETVTAQLVEAGVKEVNIQISELDSSQSPMLFSNRLQNEHQDGRVPIGRNGFVFGKVDRR